MKYHYVYRISNIKINKHYYGVRTSKIHPDNDLGIVYFSSSRDDNFILDQKENRKDYKYKIIRIFPTRQQSILLEIKLHNKFDVGVNESFYNKAKQTSTGFDTHGLKYVMTDETKRKIGNANKGRIISNNGRLNMSKSKLGSQFSEETKQKMSLSHKGNQYCLGVKASDETKLKMSNTQKNRWINRPMPMITCPHCLKEGRGGAMNQWHFDNCKKKE